MFNQEKSAFIPEISIIRLSLSVRGTAASCVVLFFLACEQVWVVFGVGGAENPALAGFLLDAFNPATASQHKRWTLDGATKRHIWMAQPASDIRHTRIKTSGDMR